MTTKAEYEVIDTIADQCISAANAVGPTLRLEQHDAIRRAIREFFGEDEPVNWHTKALEAYDEAILAIETLRTHAEAKAHFTVNPVSMRRIGE